MLNGLACLCLLLSLSSCNPDIFNKDIRIEADNNFPQWLSAGGYASNQTSGISFIKNDSSGKKHFLIADDVGSIHRLIIDDNSAFELKPVHLSSNVKEYLSRFPKKDFEEILFDRSTGIVYISLEGNMPDPKKNSGIFKLNFAAGNIFSDSVISIEVIKISPHPVFVKYLQDNIAFEGLAADENYLYLGLEGFAEKDIFADSTILFVVDKKNLNIIKEINTKEIGIYTICGLYSDKNNSLYGVDRNNKKIFHLTLDDNLNISSCSLTDAVTGIPGYTSFNYVAALESITMDNEGNLYLVDDPWRAHYIPPAEVLEKLDETTINNFRKFIPVIYKYKVLN